MTKTHVKQCVFLLVLLFAFAATAAADPVVFAFTVDTQQHVTVQANGGPVTQTQVTNVPIQISPSQFWTVNLTLTETSGIFNDQINLAVVVQHVMSPTGHGDGAGPPISFAIGVNADNAVNGVVQTNLFTVPSMANTPIAVFSVVHGPHGHLDTLTAQLQATVSSFLNFDHITGWTLTIDVTHTPEPATLVLLGLGLSGMAVKLRKRGRPGNSHDVT